MSSVNSDTYDAQQTFPADPDFNLYIGRPMVFYEALVTIATDFDAATDTANLFVVPAGLLPVPHASRVICEAIGTTATLDIGTSSDADAYCYGIDIHAAADLAFSGGVQSLAPVATTEPTTVIATLASAASLTAGKTFRVIMAFLKV